MSENDTAGAASPTKADFEATGQTVTTTELAGVDAKVTEPSAEDVARSKEATEEKLTRAERKRAAAAEADRVLGIPLEPTAPKRELLAERAPTPKAERIEDPKPVLSDAEIEKIRATAKENVAKEIRQNAMKAMLEEFEREERIAKGVATKEPPKQGRWPAYGPEPVAKEDEVQVTIALPPFADSIPVDGKVYFDGHTYWVSKPVAISLIDQMQASWGHQDLNQISSKADKFRHRTRHRDAHLSLDAARPMLSGVGNVSVAGRLN